MHIKDQSIKTPLARLYYIHDALKTGVRKFKAIGSLIDASDSDALLKFTNEVNSFTQALTLHSQSEDVIMFPVMRSKGKESSYIEIFLLH